MLVSFQNGDRIVKARQEVSVFLFWTAENRMQNGRIYVMLLQCVFLLNQNAFLLFAWARWFCPAATATLP